MTISFTPAAADRVKNFLESRGQGIGLRLGVRKTGCSGFAYVINYADSTEPQDLIFEDRGVKVFVDPASLSLIDGTEIDFVILPDLAAQLDLAPPAVAALCDRRRGLGADGVLRVTTAAAAVTAGVIGRLPDGVAADDWFMDYRNADGSVAQMCGNGVRVFAHYLRAAGLEERAAFVVGSLAGPRQLSRRRRWPPMLATMPVSTSSSFSKWVLTPMGT